MLSQRSNASANLTSRYTYADSCCLDLLCPARSCAWADHDCVLMCLLDLLCLELSLPALQH